MKILITGGCGFVGSNLAIFLKKKIKNSKIYSLDNFSRNGSKINYQRLKNNKIKNYNIDITNYNKLKKIGKFKLIIDCCAEPAIEESIKNPDKVFNTNLLGTFNILKKCAENKSNIIFLSTSRVYSIESLNKIIKQKNLKKKIYSKVKINENYSTSSPKSLYGLSKLASEELIKEFNYMHNIKYLINRFGVIAGPWQFGKQDQGFVSLWMGKHIYKKKLSYIGYGGHGNQIRDVIHIDDVCNIIFRQIIKFSKINNHIFNIGGGIKNKISLKELTMLCEKITRNKINITKKIKTSQFDIPYYVTNNKKISKYYNWSPKKNINNILSDTKNWILKYNKLLIKFF